MTGTPGILEKSGLVSVHRESLDERIRYEDFTKIVTIINSDGTEVSWRDTDYLKIASFVNQELTAFAERIKEEVLVKDWTGVAAGHNKVIDEQRKNLDHLLQEWREGKR